MSILPKPFNKLSQILGLLMLTSLLSACPSWFQPSTKVIEYDEQVKLHNGEMIWVHITRHYKLVGGAIGDPGWRESTYMPSAVEISWDTGFPNVGRKSVYFTSIQIFDKYQDSFYVVGGTAHKTSGSISEKSLNCSDIGVEVLHRRCLVALDSEGRFFKANPEVIKNFNNMNILYPEGVKNWGSLPQELDGKRLTWNEKTLLQNSQPHKFQRIGKPFLTGE